ncbi:hypothetical protein AZF37_00035 [endosymbiont 'TC1' of Trimyema compressum]|uniref:hypothetical protein n=1 Tax=endosymbiont 'TC1' of Trimyema compressum TaxID=243899 RepID=UPI0007F04E3C|nr:hypothetical protein [endosymbiont 'TC1' of Trimyema compressum]AMP19774.1 hypothetical protein AZF37_00035 [endosymbiont 'TC1' of Trimyema compressum]
METLADKKKPILTTVLTVAGYILLLCSILQFILYFVSPVATGQLTIDQLFQTVEFTTVLTALVNLFLSSFSGFALLALGRIIFVIQAKYLPNKEVKVNAPKIEE